MRVLYCSNAYPPDRGGVAAFAHDVVSLLQRQGHEVRVVGDRVAESGSCRYSAGWLQQYGGSRFGIFLRLLHLLCALREFSPDVVICSTWLHYGVHATLLKRFFGYRTVWQVHGTEVVGRYRSGWRFRWMRAVLRSASQLWANSQFTARLLLDYGCMPQCVHILRPYVPNAVLDAANAVGMHKDSPALIVTAANIYPRKGIDLVLRGLAQLQDLSWQYLVVGAQFKPQFRDQYEQLAVDLGIADRVSFPGLLARQELWRLIAKATVFVMTSRYDPDDIESFGIVYIEAQALGVPCIGARVGGVPESIAEGLTGFLIEPGDVDALAVYLRRLISQPELAMHMGRQGQARVHEHFAEAVRNVELTELMALLHENGLDVPPGLARKIPI